MRNGSRTSCLMTIAARAASTHVAAFRPPTFAMATATPVGIDAADRVLRARMAKAPQPAAPRSATPRTSGLRAVSCGTGSSEPAEITTLAVSLKCDPDLIFEYVYNNIEYEPLFGSNKGPLGTLLVSAATISTRTSCSQRCSARPGSRPPRSATYTAISGSGETSGQWRHSDRHHLPEYRWNFRLC